MYGRSMIILTFGTNEIQRDLIAIFGLGICLVHQETTNDFNYSEEQEAVRQLAVQIFSERSTHDD